MLLHLFSASRFAPLATGLFEAALPGRNEYVILDWMRSGAATAAGIPLVRPTAPACRRLVSRFRHYDAIVFHALKPAAARMMLKAPPEARLFWIGWGFEYYHWLPNLTRQLYGPRTADVLASLKWTPSRRIAERLLDGVGASAPYRRRRGRLTARAITRADVASTPIREDFDLLRQELPDFDAPFIQVIYGGVEPVFSLGGPTAGDDILLGNSGTPENNHAEVLYRLADLALPMRRVVVPLTYGPPDYVRQIAQLGRRLLGTSFCPLFRHMPMDEYDDILRRCSVAVMNHRRQQALGTIHTMLYKGAKVLVNQDSPVYRYLNRIGATVAPLDEEMLSAADLENHLSEAAVRANRNALQRTRTRAQSVEDLRSWYESLR